MPHCREISNNPFSCQISLKGFAYFLRIIILGSFGAIVSVLSVIFHFCSKNALAHLLESGRLHLPLREVGYCEEFVGDILSYV